MKFLNTLVLIATPFVCYTQSDTSFHVVDYVPDKHVLNLQDTLFVDVDGDGDKDVKFYHTTTSTGWQANLGTSELDDYGNLVDTSETRLLTNLTYGQFSGFVTYEKRYFIYRTSFEGKYYYGWILYYSEPFNTTTGLTRKLFVDKYAFCKIPNYGIRVGQTSIEQSTGLTDVTKNEFAIELVSGERGLAILAPKGIQKVEVYDVLGKRVYEGNGNGLPVYELPTLAKTSIHVIRVELEDGVTVSKKVVLD